MIGQLPQHVCDPQPNIYEGGNYVVLDFETTVQSKGSPYVDGNSIVLAVWRLGNGHPARSGDESLLDNGQAPRTADGSPYYVRWGNEFTMGDLVRHCEQADFIVAHNAKFELGWLERCGLDISKVLVWCTQIGEYVIGGNRWKYAQLSLENCAQRTFGKGKINVISKMYKAGLCSTDIPESWLEKYCIQDVGLTHELFLTQLQKCTALNLLPIVYTRCLATPVLVDVEKNGMQLDGARVDSLYQQKEIEYAEVQRSLDDFTGGINLNSPIQLREYLYETLGFAPLMKKQRGQWAEDLTDSGLRKTDSDTISRLKATTKQQERFRELFTQYKGLYNELTKYLRKFNDCVDSDEGHLDAEFNQTNTSTHRLSSSGKKYKTQFQNFPRDYKHLFCARNPGWLIGECDGAQLEFRVAAHLGRDETALRNITDPDFDAHLTTASYMEGIEYDDLLERYRSGDSEVKAARTEAKKETFKPLYGGRYGNEKQVRWYEGFRELYKGIADTQQGWVDEVLENKYLVTEWGMRYYWPNTTMDQSGYVKNTTAICNYPVQAFATAEIIPLALVCFWHRLRMSGLKMFIVNTVHDSIIVELPEEEQSEFEELSQQCLIYDAYELIDKLYGVKLTVPLGCGVSAAPNWGEGSETTYEAPVALYIQTNRGDEQHG
jgi:DNA polymerase I-like protein with 3'-5' exonuclease and polymerase domains